MGNHIKQQFQKVFQQEPEGVFFSPGRINLIGEHTDYNGGNVFPASLTMGTYGVARRRDDQEIHVYSENIPETGVLTFSLDDLDYKADDNWVNYPKGMIRYIIEKNYPIPVGMDIYFYGNIPNGAGLSSSASIELLTGVIVRDLFDLSIEMLDLVLLGKKVENEFIGVNSGIMDQFAIGMGEKDHALLLDCQTLEYEKVPVHLDGYVIAIMNTNKRRELADSKYNERRGECEAALAILQKEKAVDSLGALDNEAFHQLAPLLQKQPNLLKRARHAVSENQRTLEATVALKENDLLTFGRLLNDSHRSLKEDYEVTGKELDTIVAAAQAQPGVIGARMTGAGFGGCAIAIVPENTYNQFVEKVGRQYQKEIGYEASFYQAKIGDGAKRLS